MVSPSFSQGEDIIIGVGDSGLDVRSTYFYDPDHPVTYGLDSDMDFNHRKIAYYYSWADNVEYETDGHGTHVIGTVCGEKYNDTSIWNVRCIFCGILVFVFHSICRHP